MIVKSWQFRGYEWSQDMPEWLKTECSKRAGSPHLWIHTQAGEAAAGSGQWIAINMRGHVSIHNTKPDGWGKEIIAGAAFATLVAIVAIVMMVI